MTPLALARIVNLGEPGHPMNGSLFIASTAWPLAGKMAATNFPSQVLARLGKLSDSEVAWFNEGRHPSQGVIAISSATEQAMAGSGSNTIAGISSAAGATYSSISVANRSTGNAFQKSCRATIHALGASVRHIGEFLDPKPRPGPPNPPPETKPQ